MPQNIKLVITVLCGSNC